MAIRSVKPTSPARRYMTFVSTDDITKKIPEKVIRLNVASSRTMLPPRAGPAGRYRLSMKSIAAAIARSRFCASVRPDRARGLNE